MFRGSSPSKMNPDAFGVGTVVQEGHNNFLVAAGFSREVYLMDLETFAKASEYISVEDINFISEKEARDLLDSTKRCATFTDWFISTRGLKETDFKKIIRGLE